MFQTKEWRPSLWTQYWGSVAFLQFHLKKPFSIIPIVIGTSKASTCKMIADVLAPYLNDSSIFIVALIFLIIPLIMTPSCRIKQLPSLLPPATRWNFLKLSGSRNLQEYRILPRQFAAGQRFLHLCILLKDILMLNLFHWCTGIQVMPRFMEISRALSVLLNGSVNECTLWTWNWRIHSGSKDKEDLLEIARRSITEYITNGMIATIDQSALSENVKRAAGAFVTINKKAC